MTGTTDFLGCLIIAAFNPLNARKYLSSSKTIRSFQLVIVVTVCNAAFIVRCALVVLQISGVFRLLRLDGLVT